MTQLYELVIVADENDADYVTEISTVTMDDINRLDNIIQKLKDDPAWYTGDRSADEDFDEAYHGLSKEDFNFFDRLVPYSEYGIHTIESINYYPLPEKVELFKYRY